MPPLGAECMLQGELGTATILTSGSWAPGLKPCMWFVTGPVTGCTTGCGWGREGPAELLPADWGGWAPAAGVLGMGAMPDTRLSSVQVGAGRWGPPPMAPYAALTSRKKTRAAGANSSGTSTVYCRGLGLLAGWSSSCGQVQAQGSRADEMTWLCMLFLVGSGREQAGAWVSRGCMGMCEWGVGKTPRVL